MLEGLSCFPAYTPVFVTLSASAGIAGWYLLQLTGQKLSVGIAWTLIFVPGILFLPFSASLLDLCKARSVILFFEVLKVLLLLAAASFLVVRPSSGVVYLLSILFGLAFAPFYPMGYVAVKRYSQSDVVAKHSSLLEVSIQIACIIGVVLTGFLLEKIGFVAILFLASAFGLASVVVAVLLKPATGDENRQGVFEYFLRSSAKNSLVSFSSAIKKSIALSGRYRQTAWFGLIHQIPQNLILVSNVPLLIYVSDAMKKGPFEYGLLDAVFSVLALGCGFYWSTRKCFSLSSVALSSVCSGVTLVLFGLVSPNGLMPYLVMILLAVAMVSAKIHSRSFLLQIVDESDIGVLSSFFQLVSYVVMLAMFFLISFLCDRWHVSFAYYALGICALLYAVLVKVILVTQSRQTVSESSLTTG
ncbi:MAG: MFS transporter [Deltaproteobacteria bacterium]|nr:MFS transporter [Deltaproteobacteria bacterium]